MQQQTKGKTFLQNTFFRPLLNRAVLLCILFFFGLFIKAQTEQAPDLAQSIVLSTAKKVEDENRLVNSMNPDSLHSLPVGIVKEFNGTRYVIAIDSATFRPGMSTFSAYMALEFPGASQKIAFAAKNIGFNPEGVMLTNNSRLVLVSTHRIQLGPKITMVLKPDGTNYVEWSCNGFEAVNLKGYFEFEPGMLYGDPTFNNNSNDSLVRASFEIHCNDIHNFITQVNINPFCIRGLKDISFSVTDATVDMSELANAPAMIFPAGYNFQNGPGTEMWTGFYLKNFTVRLPREMAKTNGTRPEIFASNLILDNTGITGNFGATNIFSMGESNMSGWRFSLTQLNLNLVQNHLNGAGMKGNIEVPVSENGQFSYEAQLTQNLSTHEMDYNFSILPQSDIEMSIFSAQLKIDHTSKITVQKNGGRFIPKAILNGSINIYESNINAPYLDFQNLVIGNHSPYIESGTFSLCGTGQSNVGKFPVSITAIGLNIHPTSPSIFADVILNLMGTNDFSFSAATTVYAVGKITPPANTYEKPHLFFDKIVVNNITIEVNTQPFYLKGIITYKKDDPLYGKGFFGGITLKVKEVLESPIASNVWFGTVNNMKYWYVDASVPVSIPVGPVVEIRKLKGALYYHMKQNQAVAAIANSIHNNTTMSNPLTFIPDSTVGLGFKAGAYFIVLPNEKLANGDVQFEIEFNSAANGGGLNHVALNGQVFFLSSLAERNSAAGHKVTGTINMLYDHTTKTFDATLTVNMQMPKISGIAQCVIHLDSVVWYICVGKPSQKANFSVQNFGNISGYFMTGTQLEAMPPIPNYITAVVNCSGLQQARNNSDLKDAKGWVTGASISTSKSGSFGFDFFEVYYGFWAQGGFDMMLANYGPTAHCNGEQDKAGINGWYAQGQMYAYLSGNVGVRGNVFHKDFDITILNLQAAAILAGQAPKPTYLTGGIGCDYEIFGVFNGHIDFGFEVGNYCAVVQ